MKCILFTKAFVKRSLKFKQILILMGLCTYQIYLFNRPNSKCKCLLFTQLYIHIERLAEIALIACQRAKVQLI